MRQRLRTRYRVTTHVSTTLERTSIPAAQDTPTEFALVIVEIPPPIFPGEIWEISATTGAQNANQSDDNVFFRSEVWITEQGGDVQSGILPLLCRQTGSFNLDPEERYGIYFREGLWVFTEPVFATRYVKAFGAAAGFNIDPGDTIGILSGSVMVKRNIPFRG